jgi:DNA polymerase III subunit delta
MDYYGVVRSIERGVVSPVYLLYGEEAFLRDDLIRRFKGLLTDEGTADFNLDIVDGKTLSSQDLVNLAETLPFMTDKRIVIVNNAELFKTKKKGSDDEDSSSDKALINFLENPSDSTCLIITVDDGVDKRKKIFKLIEKNGQVVDCSVLKGQPLEDWLQERVKHHGVKIDKMALGKLNLAVGNNLYMLDQELAKMASYVVSTRMITPEVVDLLVSKTTESEIFDLVDAIGEKRINRAAPIIKELLIQGEPVIKILFMIARQIRLIIQAKLMAQEGYAEKQIASQLQIHPFVAQKCCKQGRNFTVEELKKALLSILEVDYALKTGRMEQYLAIDKLLVELCG